MNEYLIFVLLACCAIIFSAGTILGIILEQRYECRKKLPVKTYESKSNLSPITGKTVYLTPRHEELIITKAKNLVPEDDGW